MSIIDQLTPVYYRPTRIALVPDGEGGIVAMADFAIYNADGEALATDHPSVTLAAGEQSTFLAWFNDKLAAYETATGLERL